MMPRWIRKHAFTLWLCAAVALGVLFPEPAGAGGCLQPEWSTKLGVCVIFFMQGLCLPLRSLAAGYQPPRLHVFVLSWNYVWFPLVSGLLILPLSWLVTPELRVGFWLLAILPTTVASAIGFTSISGGAAANAIFATVFSNLLAVLIVPTLGLAFLAREAALELSLGSIFYSLSLILVLPLLLGQVVRHIAGDYVSGHNQWAKVLSSAIIVFLVHAAFAESVRAGFLQTLSLATLFGVLISTVLVLVVVSALVWQSAACLQLSRPQRIAAFFCASHKSLASGLPLATSILVAAPGAVEPATVLIPLLCYHPLQLLLAGGLAERFQRYS
jgi:sodium/bile acid cotransporter 7